MIHLVLGADSGPLNDVIAFGGINAFDACLPTVSFFILSKAGRGRSKIRL